MKLLITTSLFLSAILFSGTSDAQLAGAPPETSVTCAGANLGSIDGNSPDLREGISLNFDNYNLLNQKIAIILTSNSLPASEPIYHHSPFQEVSVKAEGNLALSTSHELEGSVDFFAQGPTSGTSGKMSIHTSGFPADPFDPDASKFDLYINLAANQTGVLTSGLKKEMKFTGCYLMTTSNSGLMVTDYSGPYFQSTALYGENKWVNETVKNWVGASDASVVKEKEIKITADLGETVRIYAQSWKVPRHQSTLVAKVIISTSNLDRSDLVRLPMQAFQSAKISVSDPASISTIREVIGGDHLSVQEDFGRSLRVILTSIVARQSASFSITNQT